MNKPNRISEKVIHDFIPLFLGLLLSGDAFAETVGERFDRFMKEKAAYCAKLTLLEGETTCDILKLKPADPLATPEGRLAHSIIIPKTVSGKTEYRQGMTSEEYFRDLCNREAGEFIFKTVSDVEGIAQIRPRIRATDTELQHLFAIEDPFGEVSGDHWFPADAFVQPYQGKYKFFEVSEFHSNSGNQSRKYHRYYRDKESRSTRQYQTVIDGKSVFVPYIVKEILIDETTAKYGFTWRGIERPYDRELGIAGGELIVLDIRTSEVLAVRRGFIRTGGVHASGGGVWWLGGQTCPSLAKRRHREFINEVLKPFGSS